MPADLKAPFKESCCDGGVCSDNATSAQPCGCDPGLMKNGLVIGWICERHKAEYRLKEDAYIKAYGLPQESHGG